MKERPQIVLLAQLPDAYGEGILWAYTIDVQDLLEVRDGNVQELMTARTIGAPDGQEPIRLLATKPGPALRRALRGWKATHAIDRLPEHDAAVTSVRVYEPVGEEA